MRIVKEGDQKLKECFESCNRCKARFFYGYSDIKENKYITYVLCPCCGLCIMSKLK